MKGHYVEKCSHLSKETRKYGRHTRSNDFTILIGMYEDRYLQNRNSPLNLDLWNFHSSSLSTTEYFLLSPQLVSRTSLSVISQCERNNLKKVMKCLLESTLCTHYIISFYRR